MVKSSGILENLFLTHHKSQKGGCSNIQKLKQFETTVRRSLCLTVEVDYTRSSLTQRTPLTRERNTSFFRSEIHDLTINETFRIWEDAHAVEIALQNTHKQWTTSTLFFRVS